VLVLASLFAFVLGINSGDPLGELRLRPNVPLAVIRAREAELHLNAGFFGRYWFWFSHVLRGDFGTNNDGLPVRHIVWTHLLVTARLVSLAIVVAVVLAVIVGVLSAVRQYSLLDHTATFVSFLLFSLPLFWFAALLKEFLAIRLNNLLGHQWIFTIGDSTPGLTGGFFANIGNYTGHLVLPTIALAGISYAAYSRFERASMLEVLNSDYVRLASAKGLSRPRVIIKHALRNALIPIVTVAGLQMGILLGGAVVVEEVFTLPGIGRLVLWSIYQRDYPLTQSTILFIAALFMMINLAVDLLYSWLDPRIRYS